MPHRAPFDVFAGHHSLSIPLRLRPPSGRAARRAHLALAATAAAALAGAALLLRFPPARYSFYPVCPIHYATGILCPGCGATRALALLLHGNPVQAFQQNALFVLLLPLLLCYLAAVYLRSVAGKPWPRLPGFAAPCLLALALLFTIYRNLT